MPKQPVDKIIVMTLKRSTNRQWAFMGASAIMGIDPEYIFFAEGHDNRSFDDDMQKVAKAAKADGFPFVEDYARGDQNKYAKQTAASACQIWNYCRILREIADKDETALIIFDDKMLTLDYETFLELVDEVKSVEDREFYAMQLMLRGTEKDIKLPDLTFERRKQLSSTVYSEVAGKASGGFKELFLQPGMYGYDESIVFSGAGAEWFLKCLDLAPDYYMYLDHFICRAMPMYSNQAINRGKGVYSPSEVGYKFVDTLMAFGTTTDWAVETNPTYQESRFSTNLQSYWDSVSSAKTPEAKAKSHKDLERSLKRVLEG